MIPEIRTPLTRPCHVGSLGHQSGALRQREHEHQVEEQLERTHAIVVAQHGAAQAGRRGGAHGRRLYALDGVAMSAGIVSGTVADQ